jgi:hypothetical protein
LFCRVISFYTLGYEEGMRLPIKAFWFMSNNITRIEADQDLRRLHVAISAQHAEGSKTLAESLSDRVGTVVKMRIPMQFSPERDQEGFNKLRDIQFGG